jgi:hypothetical protein
MAMVIAVVTLSALPALAQNREDRGREFRERAMTQLKERLGATDDEWKVLSPKVEKVMTAQRESRGGFGFGGFGGGGGGRGQGGGGGGGGGDQQPTTALGKASLDLRTTLENKDAPPETISKKLAALREAREKARKDVADAQKELKEVLTQRQEAVLVVNGMLE